MTEDRTAPQPPRDVLELLYRELKDQLNIQLAEFDNLDRKATVLLAPIGILIGFALVNSRISGGSPGAVVSFVVGSAALLIALTSGVISLWPRDVAIAPKPTGLEKYVNGPLEAMLAAESASILAAYELNARVRGSKTPFLYLEFVTLLFGTFALAIAYAMQLADTLQVK